MAFEAIKLYRRIELDIDTQGAVTLDISTELPGNAMAVRYSVTVNTEASSIGRLPVKIRLPNGIKGRQIKLRISGNQIVRLYGARVRAKVVGVAGQTSWQWYAVPIEPTPELFLVAALPILGTPDEFAAAPLPIDPTPHDFAAAPLPIDPTPHDFAAAPLPIPGTPDEFLVAELPIERTPDGFAPAPLPIRETPVVWTWITVPVEAIAA